jgi:predicted Rossmann-fold nucleotide-binding protein
MGRGKQSDAFTAHACRDRYRVMIFGSARVPEDHCVYAAVCDVAEELTRMGCDIVTGGGPRLMAAVNDGTRRTQMLLSDQLAFA